MRTRGSDPRLGLLLAVFAGGMLSSPARAFEQRAGTLSMGMQGGAGILWGSGEFERGTSLVPYDTFDWGGALAIHIRYALDRTHACGISFEDLRFDRDSKADPSLPGQYQLNNFLFDYYLYFHRRYKVSRYLVLGAGFHRASMRLRESEVLLPGEGLTANLGAGMEYFASRAVSFDSSLRFYYFNPKGGSGTNGELMLGLHYYLVH